MVAVYFIKTCLTVLLLLLLFSVQSAAVELSGKAKTVPENGLIELLGKEILLHGIQIISQNAKCKGSNGEWSCGKHAWRELKNKLDSGPVYCKLFSDEQYSEKNPELAKCLLKKENLSNWLVIQGWALTNKETDEFLASQEILASENNAGIWRDGFVPPDFWRTRIINNSKNCNICSIRRQSFLRKNFGD